MRNLLIILIIVLLAATVVAADQPTYKVQPGDTISEIAQQYGVSWRDLADFNGISDPTKMRAGSVLTIPLYVVRLPDGTFLEITREDQELLARLVYAEARGESFEGQVAVVAVVLNRVQSDLFPNSVEEVIYQPNQFTPVERNLLPAQADEASMKAVIRALQGDDPTKGALYFYNPQQARSKEFWETRTVIKRIGNHNFAL